MQQSLPSPRGEFWLLGAAEEGNWGGRQEGKSKLQKSKNPVSRDLERTESFQSFSWAGSGTGLQLGLQRCCGSREKRKWALDADGDLSS